MTSKEIYDNLCLFRRSKQLHGIAPQKMKENGVRMEELPTNKEKDEISNTIYYGSDGGFVMESYASYDHSRAFELRPDSNHFQVTLCDKDGNELERDNFVYWDDE